MKSKVVKILYREFMNYASISQIFTPILTDCRRHGHSLPGRGGADLVLSAEFCHVWIIFISLRLRPKIKLHIKLTTRKYNDIT